MKYFLLSLCISALTICKSSGQTIHEIDVNIPEPKFYSNHLKLGGSNSKGDKISVNNYFLSLNDRPFIPITGEFHFSRYANQYWDESIKKIKAGGINTIATYVFWNIHEEKENVFNWKEDNDLRRFVELCAKNNLYVIVRVGPFCHGEIRNHMSVLKALAVRAGFHRLKLMHFFVRDFGELLAPIVTVLPKDADKITPENITDLRYAVRVNKNSGFVFLNNFQDDTLTTDKTAIQF